LTFVVKINQERCSPHPSENENYEHRTTNLAALEKGIKRFPNPASAEINLQMVSLKEKRGSIKAEKMPLINKRFMVEHWK